MEGGKGEGEGQEASWLRIDGAVAWGREKEEGRWKAKYLK